VITRPVAVSTQAGLTIQEWAAIWSSAPYRAWQVLLSAERSAWLSAGSRSGDARDQRKESAAWEERRRSVDRRLAAYADFYSRARAFRNSIRLGAQPAGPEAARHADALARRAHDASAMVFLVVEADETADACRKVVRTMSQIQGVLRDPSPECHDWPALNEEIKAATNEFVEAARSELAIGHAKSAGSAPLRAPLSAAGSSN
jgi:hypothetical protein